MELQVGLKFFHLEDALFGAEQSVAGGADALELGNSLLKNSGLHSIRIFRERFPKIPLTADLQSLTPDSQEFKIVAESGGNAVTVSGAISASNWQKCLEAAREYKLDIALDYRWLPVPVIQSQLMLAEQADRVVLDMTRGGTSAVAQEIAFRYQTPLVLEIDGAVAAIEPILATGVSTVHIGYHDLRSQNIADSIKEVRDGLAQVVKSDLSAHKSSEEALWTKLGRLSPGQICDVAQGRPLLLENVHPLHRFSKIVGQAMTIQVIPGSHLAVPEILLDIPPHRIAVIDACGEKGAVWNYLTTAIAIKRKLTAAVIYGAVADVHLIYAKSFPCYISSLTPVEARANSSRPLVDIPLDIGHVHIDPGDWLIGDDSGIVCVPADRIFYVADQAMRLAEHREKTSLQIDKTEDPAYLKKLIKQYQRPEFPVDGVF